MRNHSGFRILQILLIVAINQINLFSQSTTYITVKVVDSETEMPLSFASVGLKNNHIGVFANAEGDFKIIHDSRFESDSVVISCIGYKQKTIPFKELKVSVVNSIMLDPAPYIIDEVKVTPAKHELNPLKIIDKAIKNLKDNYSTEPFNYVAYFRDYQKQNNDYINLNEAIIQANEIGFDNKSVSNIYHLLAFKQNEEFPRMIITPYYGEISTPVYDNRNKFIFSATLPDQGGNEFFILMAHDAIRNFKTASFSFVDVFSKDFLKNHEFSDITPTYDDDLVLYKIDFSALNRLTGDSILVFGSIYIDPRQYSIHKLDYSGAYLLKGGERKEMFNIKTEYGRVNSIDSLMYLKYISFNNIFNIVDTTDNDYFRITDSYSSDRTGNSYSLVFNNKVDSLSATTKSCYTVLLDEKVIRISGISVKDSVVVLSFDDLGRKNQDTQNISVSARNIKDVSGRVLNERKYFELYQYRELFVQEYKETFSSEDTCRLLNQPLKVNCILNVPDINKYWMNTPINPKTNR